MKARQVLLFIIASIASLALIGFFFPREGLKMGSFTLEFIHPSDILKKDTTTKVDINLVLEQENYMQNEEIRNLSDSIRVLEDFAEKSPLRIRYPEDNPKYLFQLYSMLDRARKENKTVRIIHYGDSQIEIDRISDVIRKDLQEKFGGIGPGLIPAIQTIPSRSVSQSFSGNLSRYAVYGTASDRASHRRYGIMAMMAELKGEANIQFTTRGDAYTSAKNYTKIRLIVGNNEGPFTATLSTGNSNLGSKSIETSKNGVSILTWETQNPIRSANLSLNGKADIYGIGLDGKSGIALDNVPMRGCSGTIFTGISKESMTTAFKQMDTKLILLQFGGNMMPQINNKERIEWYGEQMAKQIQLLKEINPDAFFIFIGPSDMSKNIKGNMETWPYLEDVNNELQKVALENGIAFWNMFEAMGGKNSMPEWVKANPSLATSDYIHFTSRGANRIGEMFITAFMNDYQIYKIVEKYKSSKENKKTRNLIKNDKK